MTKDLTLSAIVVAILFFCNPISICASNPNIINFDRAKYQAANKNWSISEDEKGVMYFANDQGLLEFDGIEWTLHKMDSNQMVRSVFALSNDIIYSGSYEEFGLWRREIDGKLRYTSLSDSLQKEMYSDDIWRIWHKDNITYFQSFRGIYVLDGDTITEIFDKNILFVNKVYNEFWVQEIKGELFKIINNKYVKVEGSDIFSDTAVRVILPYGDKEYLICTSDKGIFIYDGKRFRKWQASTDFTNKDLNCGILASNGNYYFGTIQDGVYVVSKNGTFINHFNSESFLQNNTVISIYEDSFNNIWTALDRGITCIQYVDNISYYIDPTGKTGAIYAAAVFDRKLFVGTNQGLYYTDSKDLRNIDAIAQLKPIGGVQGQVWNLSVIDDKLYCCYNQDLLEISQNLKIAIPYPINNGVFSINQNQSGDLLVASYNSFYLIDKLRKEYRKFSDVNEPISHIVVDQLSNVWLECMNKGIYRCKISADKQNIESLTYIGDKTFSELPSLLKLFEIGGRAAFLGENKVYTYNDINGKIEPYQSINTLLEQIGDIKRIVTINNNSLWVIGQNILYRLSYDGSTAKVENSVDIGRNNMTLIDNYENIVPLNDSLSLICLDNGFLLHNANLSKVEKREINQPYIKSFLTKGSDNKEEYLNIEDLIEVVYHKNTIKIEFSSKDAFTNNTYFQYKLEGLSGWSEPLKTNEVTYERLPEGEYTFLIRSVDRLGNYSSVTACNFEILTPWYVSTWAYIIYIIAFIVIMLCIWTAILRYYEKLHQKKIKAWESNRLKSKNEELQNEIEKKNAELLTQASFFVKKNELLLSLKNIVDEFYSKNKSSQLAPLQQKMNAMLNNNLDTEEDWKMFLIKFEEKHTGFFKKMKSMYPDLTNNDLKLCACLKLNLDTKDIASLMNLSTRAVENSRYRLRKKLNLDPSQSLSGFLIKLDV